MFLWQHHNSRARQIMEIMGMTHSWRDLCQWEAHSSFNFKNTVGQQNCAWQAASLQSFPYDVVERTLNQKTAGLDLHLTQALPLLPAIWHFSLWTSAFLPVKWTKYFSRSPYGIIMILWHCKLLSQKKKKKKSTP